MMRRLRKVGLVPRLVVATLMVGSVSAVAGAFLIHSLAQDALRSQVEDFNATVAERLAVGVDDRIDAQVRTLELLASRKEIAALSPAAATEFNIAIRISQTYEEIVLFDDEGSPLAAAAADSLLEASDIPARPELVTSVGGGDVHLDIERDGFPQLEIAVRVEDPPGRFAGVLLAKMPLSEVAGRVTASLVGSAGVAFLVDDAGTILAHPDSQRVIREEMFPIGTVLGSPQRVTSLEAGGERFLAAAAETQALPGSVVVQRSEAEAFALVTNTVRQLTLVLVAVLLGAALVISALGRHMLKPLATLFHAVTRLGRGDNSARAELHGSGEPLRLAEEFNRMADALDRNIGELEASERRLQSILDNTNATVYLKDLQGRYLFVNRRFEELTEISSDRIIGGADLDVFPEARALVNRANDLRVLASGEPMELEETLELDDGPHTFISVRFPLLDAGGRAYAVCGISTDVTERKSAEDFKRRLNDAKRGRAHALEINDNIVQGLTVALYSLELGDEDQTRDAIQQTLSAARSLISDALEEQAMGPGDLVRSRAASVATHGKGVGGSGSAQQMED